jgi:PilZ domain
MVRQGQSTKGNPMVIRQRAVRVPVEGVSLRIAAASGHLVNISATGALVRATESLTPHFEYPIYLDLPADRVQLTGRVIRSSAATSEEHVRDREDYLVAVRFTALPPAASIAVARLCGTAFTLRE